MKTKRRSNIFGKLQRTPRWKKEEFSELEYKPTSVKELLTEMKDISELIIDLGYSAVLFHNKDIAEEVKFLEVQMDKLNYDIRMTAMMAARTKDDAEQLAGILQIAEAAETISNAAGDLISIIAEEKVGPILPKILTQAEEQIFRVNISTESSACHQKIGGLRIESETGMRLIAIRRGDCWIYNPRAETILEANDRLIVRGTEEGFGVMSRFAKGETMVLG